MREDEPTGQLERPREWSRRFSAALRLDRVALVATLAMFVVPLVDTLRRWGRWVPAEDRALIEYVTRQVGHTPVLVGAYSRYGWHHPGPALFYLLAGPYRLLGSSSAALPLTVLVVNASCVVAFAVLLHRRAGPAVTVWGLLVLVVHLRQLEPGFLRDDWNPYLPLLPFTVLVLACVSLVAGDRWLLPLVLGLGSFCIQSHVGYLAGVAAVWAVTAVLLLGWRLRDRSTALRLRAWLVPALVSVLVVLVLWTPPLIDAVTGHPGNLTLLYRYFESARPGWTYQRGVRDLGTSAGWLPAWLTGQRPRAFPLVPAELPVWTGLIALAAFVGAACVALVRRDRRGLWLLGVVAMAGLASVVATKRVVGPLFSYLVPWSWSVGLLLWVAVGVVVAPWVGGALRSAVTSGERRAWRWLAVPPLVALLLLSLATGQRTAHGRAGDLPTFRPLETAVLDWLGPRRTDVVTVEFAPTVAASLTGTSEGGNAMVLGLTRAGVDVQMPGSYRRFFGRPATDHLDRAKWVVVVALADGGSPPPGPDQQFLARSGQYAVYVGPFPAGPSGQPS